MCVFVCGTATTTTPEIVEIVTLLITNVYFSTLSKRNPHRKILPQSRSLKYVDARASLFLSLLFVVAIGDPDNKVAAAAASRVTSWLI